MQVLGAGLEQAARPAAALAGAVDQAVVAEARRRGEPGRRASLDRAADARRLGGALLQPAQVDEAGAGRGGSTGDSDGRARRSRRRRGRRTTRAARGRRAPPPGRPGAPRRAPPGRRPRCRARRRAPRRRARAAPGRPRAGRCGGRRPRPRAPAAGRSTAPRARGPGGRASAPPLPGQSRSDGDPVLEHRARLVERARERRGRGLLRLAAGVPVGVRAGDARAVRGRHLRSGHRRLQAEQPEGAAAVADRGIAALGHAHRVGGRVVGRLARAGSSCARREPMRGPGGDTVHPDRHATGGPRPPGRTRYDAPPPQRRVVHAPGRATRRARGSAAPRRSAPRGR